MQKQNTWKWLYAPDAPYNWRFMARVLVKAAVLFVALNGLFALLDPLPTLGRLSAYNVLFRGRERLPYGENSAVSYNLSLFQIDAMFASHTLDRTTDDDFRVLLIGDSSVWGMLLEPPDTLAGQINRGDFHVADGRRVHAYNLGYPTMSLTKDLLLLNFALDYDPDLIVWLFTLESFGQEAQLDSALVQHNPDLVRDLITRYDLHQNPDDKRFVDLSTWDQTLVGRRRDVADLLRLQWYGVPWAITGIDQEYPDDYTPRSIDQPDDLSWQEFDAPLSLTVDNLAFDVLRAGVTMTGDTPILLINEPMFITQGQNSDLRYNFFFPRWAYDSYRDLLHEQAGLFGWQMLDLWDTMPNAECYTDSPVHLTPTCSALLGRMVGAAVVQMSDEGTLVGFDLPRP